MLNKDQAHLTHEQIGQSAELAVSRKELIFSNDINFPSIRDGNFEILTDKDRRFTHEDVVNGLLSVEDKAQQSFVVLTQSLPRQLHIPNIEVSDSRRLTVEHLRSGKPAFIELSKDKINPAFVQAVALFGGARPGVILLPVSESIIFRIPAMQNNDGNCMRIMKGFARDDLDDFIKGANYLTPPLEAKKLNDTDIVYSVEFVRDSERPVKILQTEMDDWLNRVEQSNLVFGLDVGDNDSCLDNFVRKNGRIYWVDGNILNARIAKNQEELSAFISEQKRTLSRYVI